MVYNTIVSSLLSSVDSCDMILSKAKFNIFCVDWLNPMCYEMPTNISINQTSITPLCYKMLTNIYCHCEKSLDCAGAKSMQHSKLYKQHCWIHYFCVYLLHCWSHRAPSNMRSTNSHTNHNWICLVNSCEKNSKNLYETSK